MYDLSQFHRHDEHDFVSPAKNEQYLKWIKKCKVNEVATAETVVIAFDRYTFLDFRRLRVDNCYLLTYIKAKIISC